MEIENDAEVESEQPPAPQVSSLRDAAALSVFSEAITANVTGVIGMLKSTSQGEDLLKAFLDDVCENDPDALDRYFNLEARRNVDSSRKLAAMKIAEGATREMAVRGESGSHQARLLQWVSDLDVVRVVECSDGVEEVTLGTIPLGKMHPIISFLVEKVILDEGEKMCFNHDKDDGDAGDADTTQRFYDGSIAITPESMFDRSFDEFLTDLFGGSKSDAEEISEMSGIAYEADEDDEEEGEEEDPDLSDFLTAVVEKAEEELRSVLEDMHKEVYAERNEAKWYKKCIKLKDPAPATSKEDAGDSSAKKKRKVARGKWFSMERLPLYERRPILTILYDNNQW